MEGVDNSFNIEVPSSGPVVGIFNGVSGFHAFGEQFEVSKMVEGFGVTSGGVVTAEELVEVDILT